MDLFKTQRDELPRDSDGIYLVVEGMAKVQNAYDNLQFAYKLKEGDYFGASKFIRCFGFSQFGDVLAYREQC